MLDALYRFKPTKDYLVCIDSDGCLMDNMELKHKECFCPATVNVWQLQAVSRWARETAEFVNLYSTTRGTNRFPAVVRTLELCCARPEVKAGGYTCPDLSPLKRWIGETAVLSAGALAEYVKSTGADAPALHRALAWSREVDENIARIVRNVQPFPHAKDAVEALREFADVVIVSATPLQALERELGSCGITPLVSFIAGQEVGTKSQCIRAAMAGKYDPAKVLKIGDAPGDHRAAQENGVLFHPIVPGLEADSWRRILEESVECFRRGRFAGAYMDGLLAEFYAALPEVPPWERTGAAVGSR